MKTNSPSIELAISTVEQRVIKNKNLFETDFDLVTIINQVSDGKLTIVSSGVNLSSTLRQFNFEERGLAKSRNRAIENSSCDWILFADDDLSYSRDASFKLKSMISDEADIIFFGNIDESGPRPTMRWSKLRLVMSATSWVFAVRKDFVVNHNIRFDERFGLGSDFISTEENSFVLDVFNAGGRYKILDCNLVEHRGISTGWHWNEDLIASKAAFFKRNIKSIGYIFPFLFVLKKLKDFSEVGLLSALRAWRTGWNSLS